MKASSKTESFPHHASAPEDLEMSSSTRIGSGTFGITIFTVIGSVVLVLAKHLGLKKTALVTIKHHADDLIFTDEFNDFLDLCPV